jgi:uncharacterized protein YajQ (UPF0234 family)
VVEILFQFIALKRVDSILFWEQQQGGAADLGGDRPRVTEVHRADLQAQMQQLMRQQLNQPPSNLA